MGISRHISHFSSLFPLRIFDNNLGFPRIKVENIGGDNLYAWIYRRSYFDTVASDTSKFHLQRYDGSTGKRLNFASFVGYDLYYIRRENGMSTWYIEFYACYLSKQKGSIGEYDAGGIEETIGGNLRHSDNGSGIT